jgi:hypothetical protein
MSNGSHAELFMAYYRIVSLQLQQRDKRDPTVGGGHYAE